MTIEMAPCVILENLENLYFELVPKGIDLRKKRLTYLSKEKKRSSQLLGIDAVKEALKDVDKSKLKKIYLIGSEPIFNPDFNKILRLCLKVAPTIVVTGAQNINEKKARFLDKVQNESEFNHSLIFNIILYHYDERINDTYCTRGDFRKVMHAISSLQKYGFLPEITIKNLTNSAPDELLNGFKKVFKIYGIILPKINIKTEKELPEKFLKDINKPDFITAIKHLNCAKSRVFSSSGVFSCPNLVGDNRARMGASLRAYSKTNYLETPNCQNCLCESFNK